MVAKLLSKDIITVTTIIVFSVYTSTLISGQVDLYFVDYLLKSIIAFAFILIMIYSIYDNKNMDIEHVEDDKRKYFRILAIGYGFIAIILFIKSIVFYGNLAVGSQISKSNEQIISNIRVLNATYYFTEIVILIIFCRGYIRNNKINIRLITKNIAFIVLGVYSITVFAQSLVITLMRNTIVIRNLGIVSGYTFLIYYIYKNKDEFLNEDSRILIFYLFLRVLYFICITNGEVYFSKIWFYFIETIFVIGQYNLLKFLVYEIMINPQKRLNFKMKEILERQDIIFKNIPDAVLLREGNKIVYTNNRYKELFNFQKDTELGGNEIDKIFNIEDMEYITDFEESLRKSKQCLAKVHKYKVNNIEVEVEESGVLLPNTNSNTYLFISRDLKTRREYDEMRLRLEKKEEEDRVKNEFISNISHEFKTPINVIYAATQMQESNYLRNNHKENEKYTKSIKQNCLRLIRLVNNIIDISKIEGGYFNIEPKIINVVAQVESITDSIVDYAKSQNLSLIFDTMDEEIYTLYDEDSLERIMLNILSNAIKFSRENGEVFVIINKDTDFVYINVKDNGKGMTPEELNIIFNRFERLDNTLSRTTEGSGIGLNLVKAIVELNNGTISAKSTVNEGTTITVKIPLIKEFANDYSATKEKEIKNNLIERIEVEFSDIYF